MKRITPFLWFDDNAEDAAKFYTSIFKKSKITKIARYGDAGSDVTGRPAGSVMTVAFVLDGQHFTALNGGPVFQFNEAVSFVVDCATQEEIDYYWKRLSKGGKTSRCGWLKDKFGVSWQIVPQVLGDLMSSKDSAKAERVMSALLKMTKLDIKRLQLAAVKK